MEELPQLISDLALILIVAGVVTLLFKRLRQPLVLGYIVAGFLAGPHMPYTPTVEDTSSITTWSSIGVIFLMFTLGLEFSFKKIVKMGMGPVVAACTVMACMIGVGSGVGRLFGWSHMDCLFLGGMLAMSSTTIIYKAFDDLGLRQRKFAGEVLSVLILEDILGILLMVILSAMAVSQRFEGLQLAGSLLTLGFFLILWFVVGIFVVPLFFRHTRRWMNRETLVVVSVGLCFLLVVLAAHAGYSTAFGAFMMGSILAETVEAESIERVVAPVKDLFGAIFFVSVGMLVDPQVLVQYRLPIAVITVSILVGQMVLGTLSFIISGQTLRVAMQCGFSLAQIGEFAFIIASLGLSLGVTSGFLYPVVVAVSIVTTFLTPYMIRAAEPAYHLLERMRLPGKGKRRKAAAPQPAKSTKPGRATHGKLRSPWKSLLRALLSQTATYTVLSVAVVGLAFSALLPLCRTTLTHWPGNAVCGLLTLLCTSPFLRAIVMRKNHSEEFKQITAGGRISRMGLWLTVGVRYAVATAVVYYVLNFLSPLRWYLHVVAALFIVLLMVMSRQVKMRSIRLERTFLQNLRSREVKARMEAGHGPAYAGRLETRNVHIARLQLPDLSSWAGRSLQELNFGKTDGIMIAAVLRGSHRINIPDGNTRLFPGDVVEAIGDDDSLARFAGRMEAELHSLPTAAEAGTLMLRRLIIGLHSPFIGQTLQESGIRSHYQCMVVGFEEEDGSIAVANSHRVIHHTDAIWIVGEEHSLVVIMAANNPKPAPAKA